MIFLENHPAIAGRSCERCKKYWYDKDGKEMEREPGVPEPRTMPPDCLACPKKAPDSEMISPQNYMVYKKYIACKALGCLPLPGGLDSQDPEVSRKFQFLAMIDRQRELARMAAPSVEY